MHHPIEVQCVRWWMGHYDAPTPKRHYAYANTPVVLRLDRGVLQKWKPKTGKKVKTVEHYVDKNGKKRYKGTKQLRGTENLVCKLLHILLDSVGSSNSIFIHVWDGQLEVSRFAGITLQLTTVVFKAYKSKAGFRPSHIGMVVDMQSSTGF